MNHTWQDMAVINSVPCRWQSNGHFFRFLFRTLRNSFWGYVSCCQVRGRHEQPSQSGLHYAGLWCCTDLPAQYTSATARQCWRCATSCTNANRTSRMRTADVMARSINKCANHRPHRMAAGWVAGVKGKQRLESLINDKWLVQHQADLWRTEWH